MDKKPESAADVSGRLKSVQDYVLDCQRRVNQGEIMDLDGLDKAVIGICDAVASLPPAEAQALEDKLGELIGSLEELADAMRARQEEIDGEGGDA